MCKVHQTAVIDFTAGPVFMDGKSKGKHEWIVEFKSPPKNCFDSIIKDPSKRSVKKVIEATIPTAKDKEKNIRRSCPDLNSLKKIFVANEKIVI